MCEFSFVKACFSICGIHVASIPKEGREGVTSSYFKCLVEDKFIPQPFWWTTLAQRKSSHWWLEWWPVKNKSSMKAATRGSFWTLGGTGKINGEIFSVEFKAKQAPGTKIFGSKLKVEKWHVFCKKLQNLANKSENLINTHLHGTVWEKFWTKNFGPMGDSWGTQGPVLP